MSRENVELSREGFRRFEAGDIDGLVALYAENAILWHPEGWPEPGPSIGRDAARDQFHRLREGWQEHTVKVERIEDHGEWVIAEVTWEVRGEGSGAPAVLRYAAATRCEDGMIAEVAYCWTFEDALEAAASDRHPARQPRAVQPAGNPRPA